MGQAHLDNDIGVLRVQARVVKADGGRADGAAVQRDSAEVERDAVVGRRVLYCVQARAVARLVKDDIALYRAVQDQAGLAPAPRAASRVTNGVLGASFPQPAFLWLSPGKPASLEPSLHGRLVCTGQQQAATMQVMLTQRHRQAGVH